MSLQSNIQTTIRNFFSKEFFIFLFFLLVSAAFWFMSTLNDTYEREYPFAVEITDVPRDIVITQPLPDTIRVTLRDKGFNLLRLAFTDVLTPIQLHFDTYAAANGRGIVNPADVQKILRNRLEETTSVTSVKSNSWEFFYNHGASKKVPVFVDGQLLPARNYYVTNTMISPDSVIVYAALPALDTIRAVYTATQNITGIKSSFTKQVKLQYITGAKIVPDNVKMTVLADQMTEVTVNVPITPVNVPEGMSLKTFPARMNITVAVALKRANTIRPELFSLVADYNDIPQNPNEKIRLRIQTQPTTVIRASLQSPKVDYVIEKF